MAEQLLEFVHTVEDEAGESWIARVMGREREDGLWVGWIEFEPVTGGAVRVTERETTQPNRADLKYWAGGPTYVFLEGAPKRATPRRAPGG